MSAGSMEKMSAALSVLTAMLTVDQKVALLVSWDMLLADLTALLLASMAMRSEYWMAVLMAML